MKAILVVAAVLIPVAIAVSQDVPLRPGDPIRLRLGGVPLEEIEQVSGEYQVDGKGFLNFASPRQDSRSRLSASGAAKRN